RQLLASLISNAVKFTASGRVTVEVAITSAGAPAAGESQIEFRVRDTGRGIDPTDQERIFGAFEQIGDPSRSQSMAMGSGLGLTVARRLAHLLSGTLWLESASPAGSCFCLGRAPRIP